MVWFGKTLLKRPNETYILFILLDNLIKRLLMNNELFMHINATIIFRYYQFILNLLNILNVWKRVVLRFQAGVGDTTKQNHFNLFSNVFFHIDLWHIIA